MDCNVFYSLLSGIFGAFLGSTITWFSQSYNRKQQLNLEWFKAITDHNWKLLENKISSPSKSGTDIRVNCYQHLNLLFLAWTTKGLLFKGKLLRKLNLRNWVKDTIIIKAKNDKTFANTYMKILTSGDMYSEDFIKWLKNDMKISHETFKDISDN